MIAIDSSATRRARTSLDPGNHICTIIQDNKKPRRVTTHLGSSYLHRFSQFFKSVPDDVALGRCTGTGYDWRQWGREGNGFDVFSNSYDLRSDWGGSGTTRRHAFSVGINSRLPMDVYLNTTIAAGSGDVYDIATGKGDNQDGVANDRPMGVLKLSGTDRDSLTSVSISPGRSV